MKTIYLVRSPGINLPSGVQYSRENKYFCYGIGNEFIETDFGVCINKSPEDEECWRYSNVRIKIEWERASELHNQGGKIRLEGKGLPVRVLLVCAMDCQYHAFRNRSNFMGRGLDPVSGKQSVHSCDIFKSVLIIRAT
jgi:hypothetical protein